MIRAKLFTMNSRNTSIAAAALLLSTGFGLLSARAQSIQLGNLEFTLSRPVFNNTNSGLRNPTAFDTPNDGSGKFYSAGLSGRISQFAPSGPGLTETVFLNVPQVLTGSGAGLLGMAFHPEYSNPASPGYHKLYTYHSTAIDVGASVTFSVPGEAATLHNVVTEWQASVSNPNIVDVATKREIYREAHPHDDNHNGGTLEFGPDGYLYVSTGAPPGVEVLAQSLDNIQGKILRIDPLAPALTPTSLDPVSGNGNYRVPATNPFVSEPTAIDEIYAIGLRNPYKFSVDSESGLVFVGDVGQGAREEVSAFSAGANLGWPYREGFTTGIVTTPVPAPTMLDPIADYTHADGHSVTGGFVYHGSIPELQGKYIFGDFLFGAPPFGNPGRLFWLDPFNDQGELRDPADIEIKEFRYSASTHAIFDSFSADVGDNIDIAIYSFGVDDAGEIYIQGEEANKLTIYKIQSVINLSPPGDFDGDLDVDSGDLAQWQGDYGIDGDSDADGDGDSDGRDFLIWQRNFGMDAGLVATATVPEPTTCLLACAMLGSFICYRPRRLVT